jgi:hypothetical protein
VRKAPQPVAVILCFCAALWFPVSSFGQFTKSTDASPSASQPCLTNNFSGVSLFSTETGSLITPRRSKLESSSAAPNLTPPPPPKGRKQPLPRFGIAASAGTLGFGVQAATAVLRRANVRVGFNFFNYNLPTFNKDGAKYTGSLNLRSFEAEFDYYLVWGIHISPGALLYDGNTVDATAFIPGGSTFTLGSTSYTAQGNITGTGTLPLNRTSPLVKLGFGNLLPRSHRHLTYNFDLGAVFQKPPQVGISLVGTACPSGGGSCVNVATDPTVQTNIRAEEAKMNQNLKFFRYYPILSMSIGWKF